MKLAPLLLLLGVILLFPACIEGPEIEQDPFYDVPDGTYPVILLHAISVLQWNPTGMDSAQYAEHLLSKYGETHTVTVYDLQIERNIVTIDVPTIPSKVSENCYEVDGILVDLRVGYYEIYNEEDSWRRKIDDFSVRDDGDLCRIIEFDAE